MQAEDKYNQIASWFNTPEPSPEPPTPTPSKTVRASIADSIVSIAVSFGMALVIFMIFGAIGIITYIIGSIWAFFSSAEFNNIMEDYVAPILITLAIIVSILTIIIVSISDARDDAREKARKKAEYDEAKAEYDEAVAKYDALPSVSQMEQWLEEDLENLKKGALQKMALDTSEIIANEVIMRVPSRWSPRSTKATEHKYYLFPVWHLTILYICERSIAIYRCEYDWSDNRLFNESRNEYFYSDMGGIERQSAGFDEIIRIRLSGGKSEEIVLNEQGCPEPSNRADMAARTIRSRIKDNKPKEPKPDD